MEKLIMTKIWASLKLKSMSSGRRKSPKILPKLRETSKLAKIYNCLAL
jgi:hypothetical protein